MKTVKIPNGIIHLIEVKNAFCQHCTYKFNDEEKSWLIDKVATVSRIPYKYKCPKCGRKNNVYQQITGDLIISD